MDGKGRRGIPNREWIDDDIKEWCKKDLYSLIVSARDRGLWKQTTKFVLDTYTGCQPMDHDAGDKFISANKRLKFTNALSFTF